MMARNSPVESHTYVRKQGMMQAVFRVSMPFPTKSTRGLTLSNKPAFHARRSHKKSRTGCKSCKQRRIKCDENREGGCYKCQSHGIECDYNAASQSSNKSHAILPKGCASSSISDVAALVKSVESTDSSRSTTGLSLGHSLCSPFPVEVPDQIMPVLLTLNHFSTVTCCCLGSDMGQNLTRATVLDFALEKPYLMHAASAVAADHLCHLLPADQHPVQHRQGQLAGLYHWQKALQMFRDELVVGVNEHNMDALVSTVMLVCVPQFLLADAMADPANSFVYAPEDERNDRLAWVQIHHGFMALHATLGDVIWGSVWNPVFQDSDVKRFGEKVMNPQAGDKIHALFLEICEITPNSTVKNNAYYEALEFLLYLRQVKPSVNRFNKLITFVAVFEDQFLRLSLDRDKRALLILAHWLALLDELHLWWSRARCRCECIAITTFLMHDCDERVQTLLTFPASTVGIVLPRRGRDSYDGETELVHIQ